MSVVAFLLLMAAHGLIGWHMLHGKRSLAFQQQVQERLEQARRAHAEAVDRRKALERKVARLRDRTLDIDMLDERARHLLGFVAPDEILTLPTVLPAAREAFRPRNSTTAPR